MGEKKMKIIKRSGAEVTFDPNKIVIAVTKANLQEEELAKAENREPRVLEMFSPHCFRHTFITRCKKNGIPYEIIKP